MIAPIVVVVGGGASGTLAATQLARSARGSGRELTVVVVEPGELGQGLAYSTMDPRHRLNVAAAGMSAYPDDPGHFLEWLRRHVSVDFAATAFAPRLHYAQYLVHSLETELALSPRVRLEHRRSRVTDLRRHGRLLRVVLDDGTIQPADAVVLATGHGRPATRWAPSALCRSPRFVADPWRTVREPAVRPGDSVLLVGAGLTMADMAVRWGKAGVQLHVISRHGLLPLPHAEPGGGAPPLPAATLPASENIDLSAARHFVFDQIRAAGGDWRAAVDGLRPVTADLWRRLELSGRAAFLRSGARRWDRVRHRIDPTLTRWLNARTADGELVEHVGEVTHVSDGTDGITVHLSDGAELTVAAVVNCTGSDGGLRDDNDPLVLNLLDSELAQPGPLGLGYATDPAGRLLPPAAESPAVWVIGPLRRGQLWETTAIPEIRVQAAEVARAVLSALPSPRLQRRPRDPYGLPITASGGAAEAYVEALGRILRVQSGAETLIAEAVAVDPDFALGHAVLALLGVEWGADVDVDAALAAAQRAASRCDERERRFIDFATERVHEPRASESSLLAYIHSYPEDALAVSIAVPTIAFGGATEIPAEAWALVEGIAPAYRGDWWHTGLLAFIRQEQERFAEALELATRSLALEPAAGHAVHARTHVHYETDDHQAGLGWLNEWIATCGAQASHRAHFSWHAALHELALGDDQAVQARYCSQLAPPTVVGVRALVDSASLLWRGHLSGMWPIPDIGPVLATVPPDLLSDPPTAFVALHAAVALAAAGDCTALARLRRRAAARPEPVFTETVAPLADALAELLHGDPDRATDTLLAISGVERLGGSAAQREIVEDTLIYCAAQAGRPELATTVLSNRRERRAARSDGPHRRRNRQRLTHLPDPSLAHGRAANVASARSTSSRPLHRQAASLNEE